ncbi:MAG TPA: hypothetical protein VIG99_19035 [Myxococcaceae bacterium]|jgi:hypothetical protein
MATVTFSHLGYITSIAPGVTHHWWWNNAAAERVWAFSVDAMIPLNIPPAPGATARVEVTTVEYREVYNGPGNLEKEIHYWIKNTGTIDAEYAIHMATIRE